MTLDETRPDEREIGRRLAQVRDREFQIQTKVIERGLANVGCFLHSVVIDGEAEPSVRFFEKRTRHINETAFAPKVQIQPLPCGKPIGPEIYAIVQEPAYRVIFMEYIEGVEFRSFIDAADQFDSIVEEVSDAMLSVATYQGEIDTQGFAMRTLLEGLDQCIASLDVLEQDRAILAEMRASVPRRIRQLARRKPMVASHNDIFFANMIRVDDGRGGTCVRMIDWALCKRNLAGADLHHFVSSAIDAPRLRAFTNSLVERYHAGLRRSGVRISKVDVLRCAAAYAWMRAVVRLRRRCDTQSVASMRKLADILFDRRHEI